MNQHFALNALSPLDGRYHAQLDSLRAHLSEYGLIRRRVLVQVRWLESLCQSPDIPELAALTSEEQAFLHEIIETFDESTAEKIKATEASIKHDVKAVEYYVRERLESHASLNRALPFVHFACTSEDVNSTAYALMLSDARAVMLQTLEELKLALCERAETWASLPALAYTHGQPATPTTLGKELAVFIARIQKQGEILSSGNALAKMSGATGNYAAHSVAYPDLDWRAHSQAFMQSLGLEINPITTQIEPHDYMAEWLDALARVNTVLLDFSRDTWGYISRGWFLQKVHQQEVGSSTMPHKINPIDFENAEGNLGVANALAQHLARKLPISRWQRDLSDSTALRNLGVAFGHSLLGWQMLIRGLERLEANPDAMQRELDSNPEVLAEAIQTVMRKHGQESAYEQLKELTRGKHISLKDLSDFVGSLTDLPKDERVRIQQLLPSQYTGLAQDQALEAVRHCRKRSLVSRKRSVTT